MTWEPWKEKLFPFTYSKWGKRMLECYTHFVTFLNVFGPICCNASHICKCICSCLLWLFGSRSVAAIVSTFLDVFVPICCNASGTCKCICPCFLWCMWIQEVAAILSTFLSIFVPICCNVSGIKKCICPCFLWCMWMLKHGSHLVKTSWI